jgi:gas vesicle protein
MCIRDSNRGVQMINQVQLNTELSAYALELYMEQFSTPTTIVDSKGAESYTQVAQDKFDEITSEIDSILVNNGGGVMATQLDEQMKEVMEALRKAIDIETPKLKEGQKLKSEISFIDEGIKVYVYPVAIEEDE